MSDVVDASCLQMHFIEHAEQDALLAMRLQVRALARRFSLLRVERGAVCVQLHLQMLPLTRELTW